MWENSFKKNSESFQKDVKFKEKEERKGENN